MAALGGPISAIHITEAVLELSLKRLLRFLTQIQGQLILLWVLI